MASEDINDAVELGDNQNAKTKRIANFDSGVADLEKVTDYVEEAEILSKNLCDVSTKIRIYNNFCRIAIR